MNAPQVDVSYHDLNSLNDLRKLASKDKVGAVRQAAQQFESVFMGMLLSSMRKASAPMEEGNPLNSNATGFFRDMYDNQLATHLSKSGSLGLADLMVRQLAPEAATGGVIAPARESHLQKQPVRHYALHPSEQGMKLPQQRQFQLDPERVVMPVQSANAPTTTVSSTQTFGGQVIEMPVAPTTSASAASAVTHKMPRVQQLAAEQIWQAGQLASTVNRSVSAPESVGAGGSQANQLNTPAVALQPSPAVDGAQLTDPLAQLQGPEADFVRQLLPSAKQAARQLGLEPLALVAQAALETGWGQKLFKAGDGQSSHNLFGIKAGSNWQGQVAVVDTLEYRQGLAQKEKARFRVYQDFADSMHDYVELVKNQPRYQDAVAASHDTPTYFRRLQAAGYATDPNYAEKVLQVLQSSVFKEVRNLLGSEVR